MKMLRFSMMGLVIVGLMMLSAVSFARGHKGHKQGMKACEQDVETFCAGVERGEGRIIECLKANFEQLSPQCAEKIGKMEKRREAIEAACGDDAQQLCPGLEGKQLRKCMKSHRDELSPECEQVIGKHKKGGRHGKHNKGMPLMKKCGEDIAQYCEGVGRDGMKECLNANWDSLSPTCQQVITKMEERRAEAEAACGQDAQQLCPGLEGRELHRCMKDNMDSLSPQCLDFISEMQAKRGGHKAVRQACRDDVMTLCGDVERGEVRECIEANFDKLSPPCQEAIQQAQP